TKVFQALQMGYYFGIAYACVDSLQDEIKNTDILKQYQSILENTTDSQQETIQDVVDKWLLIMEKFLCGEDYDRTKIPKTTMTPFLLETFDCLLELTHVNNVTLDTFNDLALLLRSQRSDKKETAGQ
ncbi:unnamed protein product, partial [Didymodactylos carnosus]